MKAIILGDAEPAKARYSQADDATLANPWGPTVRGRQATQALEFVGTDLSGRIGEIGPQQ
jgi:hypothetical protein